MGREDRHIPPLFQGLDDAPGEDAQNGERNVLADVPDKLLPLERQKYEVAEELKVVVIVTIAFTALTSWMFPVLPETVNVGGWALWWLGGAITTVMEWVAHLWIVAVVLGGLSFFLAVSLVVLSHWLKEATRVEQYLMYGSAVLSIPNVLALLAIVALWAAVIVVWLAIAAIAYAILGGILMLFIHDR
jgi:hypothetical protein